MSWDIHGTLGGVARRPTGGEEDPARILYRAMLPGVEDAEDVAGAVGAVEEGAAGAVGAVVNMASRLVL